MDFFQHLVDNLKNKVEIFGLHFASLDIRQDSSVHSAILESLSEKGNEIPKNYSHCTAEEKINILSSLQTAETKIVPEDSIHKDNFETIRLIKQIQKYNGEEGCNRYIISQCSSAINVMEVFALFLLAGWKKEEMNIDIVPLFETIDDLQNAVEVMEQLYKNPTYKNHLQKEIIAKQ